MRKYLLSNYNTQSLEIIVFDTQNVAVKNRGNTPWYEIRRESIFFQVRDCNKRKKKKTLELAR